MTRGVDRACTVNTMPTNIHLASGQHVRVDEDLPEVQHKLNADAWALFENNGRPVAVRLDQVTHIETVGGRSAGF